MGLMQRRKGRAFEQRIASLLREEFPSIDIRRSSQADRAVQSDVYCTGHPLLERLWLELNDARNPQPLVKLEQAENDCQCWAFPNSNRLPVVIWHRLREQAIYCTMRLWVLDAIRGELHAVRDEVVTMTLDSFVAILKERAEQKEAA